MAVQTICGECGPTNIEFDAVAVWNFERQEYDLLLSDILTEKVCA